jgi:predicted alpha/beta-hydrolase family hydrolase
MTRITPFHHGSTNGFLHSPAGPPGDGLVLTHGAGGNCQSPLLVVVADAFASSGLTVLRCNLPFRQDRPYGHPFPAQAEGDRNGLKEAITELQRVVPGRIFLGGHSYGGRQASILASEQRGLIDRLLLLSYPLHPPKKPEQLRTAHFSKLQTPALFVHGSKDPFGSIDEVRAALELIPAATILSIIEKAGHDLNRGRFDVAKAIIEPFCEAVPA